MQKLAVKLCSYLYKGRTAKNNQGIRVCNKPESEHCKDLYLDCLQDKDSISLCKKVHHCFHRGKNKSS